MAFTITKEPLKLNCPVGQDTVWTVHSTNALSSSVYKFKYGAVLYTSPNGGIILNPVATLKYSANSSGYGILATDKLFEQYVSSDNLGQDYYTASTFKGVAYSEATPHPIHLIDELCLNTNSWNWWWIIFYEEWATTPTAPVVAYTGAFPSLNMGIFNGTDYGREQNSVDREYGIDISDWNGKNFMTLGTGSTLADWLTNAPYKQYVSESDYHTMAFLSGYTGGATANKAKWYRVSSYDSSGVFISSWDTEIVLANGGYDGTADTGSTDSRKQLQFIGVGVANFTGAGNTMPAGWDYYTVDLLDNSKLIDYSVKKRFYKQEPDCKGFEKIRLTWLNQYGVWDYYNFNKKSLRSTDIKQEQFEGVPGDWNGNAYTKHGYQRGRRALNTQATMKIKCNSDWFTTDEEAIWMEELFISNEVYILNGYDSTDTGTNGANYGKYVIPVMVKSKKYERYTEANDKVAQYEIDIEYAYNKRVQKA